MADRTHSLARSFGLALLFLVFAACNGPVYPFWGGPDTGGKGTDLAAEPGDDDPDVSDDHDDTDGPGVVSDGMVWVAGGAFQMGSTTGNINEQPVHSVTLSSFYMGKYEVTQAEYEAVMEVNPSGFTTGADGGETQSKRPVERVSWYDALVYSNKLSISEGLTPVYSIGGKTNPGEWGSVPTTLDAVWNGVACNWNASGYRLPTEAEWEYAARGGNGSPGSYEYSGSNTVSDVAWYDGNSNFKTHEVGKKAPNGLGLYDMSGNVNEWCWDWFDVYGSAAQNNPMGASSGYYRVLRSGGRDRPMVYMRPAQRITSSPFNRHLNYGFRLVRSGL